MKYLSFSILPLIGLLVAVAVAAQAPPAIQFFMPGGGLPDRPLRFTLTRTRDGIPDIYFTDTKGKFLLTGELARDGDYTVVIEGDKRTFETTRYSYRIVRNLNYLPIFLAPIKSEAAPKTVVEAAAYDAKVPAEARAAYDQAIKAVNAGDSATAISELARALALYPQYLRALNDLGVLYLKLNRLTEAAATFNQAITLNARFYFPRLNLAVVRNHQGDYQEAVNIFSKLLKEQPSLSQARVPYAEALSGLQKWDDAAAQLREALQDKNLTLPLQAEAHLKLGVLLNQQERYEAAVKELEQAITLQPDSASAHLYLGAAWLQLKKLTEAERALVKAYELAGNRVGTAQLLLGQIYHAQQKYDLALRAFEQYLKDVPNAPNAAQIQDFIAKLKASLKPK
jgi:tetratricopeptide (TPR) repeat protein